MNHTTQELTAWHAISVDELSKKLVANEHGLSEKEAASRLVKYGPNHLPQKPPVPLWLIVLRQFRSPLIYILGVAAVVSAAMGDFKDAGFIAGLCAATVLTMVVLPVFYSVLFNVKYDRSQLES